MGLLLLAMIGVAGCAGGGVYVSGRIMAENEPVYGAAVTLGSYGSVMTDYDGKFEIAGVKPGAYQLKVAKAGFVAKSVNANVAATTDLGEVTIVPNDGTWTVEAVPSLGLGPTVLSELPRGLSSQSDSAPLVDVQAEITFDLACDDRHYESKAILHIRMENAAFVFEHSGSLKIMGVEPLEEGKSYTLTATMRLTGSSSGHQVNATITVEGECKRSLVDDRLYTADLAINLSSLV